MHHDNKRGRPKYSHRFFVFVFVFVFVFFFGRNVQQLELGNWDLIFQTRD